MRIQLFIILTLVFLFGNSATAQSASREPKSEIVLGAGVKAHLGIDDIYRSFRAAYRKLDQRAVTDLYADDAFYLSPGREVKRGRTAILAEFSRFFDSVRNGSGNLSISFEIMDRSASPSLGYDVGIYTVTETYADRPPRIGRGKFVLVMQREQSGQWRVQVDGYNYLPDEKSDASTNPELEKLFDPIFSERMKASNIPGGVIAVVRDGRIVFSKGYGVSDLEKKTLVVPDKTIFRIGSITKVFTALAVMQLADTGKIKLTDDVNKYLTGVKVPNAFSRPVTFANLLTHTSGFDEITPGRRTSNRAEVIPLGEFLKTRIVRQLPPGEIIFYNTYNPSLAAYAVEQVTKTPFKNYLDKNVFEPLGMDHSSITAVKEPYKQDLATGYEFDDGKHRALPFQWFNTFPASDINSTATDMARFMIAMLQNGVIGDKRVLSERAAREMQSTHFRNHPRIPGWAYGFYEIERNGLRLLEHGGSMDDGYSAMVTMIPEKGVGLFVAANTESGAFDLAGEVKTAFINKYFPDKTPPLLPKTPNPPVTELQKFAGKYRGIIYCHSCAPNTSYVPEDVEITVTQDGFLLFGGERWKQIEPLLFLLAEGERAGRTMIGFKENEKGEIGYVFRDSYKVFERVSK